MRELLDYYDDNMNYMGRADRVEVHSRGLWHKTFHCWVLQSDSEGDSILLQRRGRHKTTYPGKLDITAAGHLEAGESPEDGVREFQEELGVALDVSALHFLGIRVAASIAGKEINREFNHVYLFRSTLPLDVYRLQRSEVASLVRMPVNEGLRLFAREVNDVRVTGFEVSSNGTRSNVDYQATLDDVIPRKDNYYLKIFMMAQRLLEGRTPICI
jgi:isopentenyldiphosphate isomerase